ncbi:MAG: transporter substrate-binding domain-containing protein [Spirochaetales bacterium]|nr:transporter substrate-binding domain-containing protein [Spirochaetales bacterium]MCF7939842.1 transporter substrate-binding domain-containing protein [Spirochaetales bacterium]
MKKGFALALVLFMVSLAAFAGGQAESAVTVEEEEPLRVGMEMAYPPFEMTDEQGNPSGISVDFAKALGDYLGREVEFVNMAWDGLIPSLRTGKIDVIISSMTITEERKESVDFSEPYAKAYLAMLIAQDSPVEEISDLNDPDRNIAVKKGTTGHVYAQQNLPEANLMVFDKETACVLEVAQGKADAFLYDQMTIFKNWQKHQDTTRVNLKPFQEDLEYWGAALRKDDDELRKEINAFIEEFRADGGFDKLGEKYLAEMKQKFDEMGIPFFFNL